ncbi:hypothetical protein DM860_004955 [Cuscuta australis]|uniref:Uncharacterized protein n=1 Tax=Cuscuta australis TaxID=267555 RepID=A0A328DMG8_9ASTE|nr:hypothetical protein DM860_004955 [Cuscuta australis]
MGGDRASSSSSGEEDGDAEWRAAIDSIAAATPFRCSAAAANGLHSSASITHPTREDESDALKPPKLTHYQIKAQKLLDDIIEKAIEVVSDTRDDTLEDPINGCSGGGIRLFKRAPPGIADDPTDELNRNRKKPRILPGKEIKEGSKEFKKRIKSVSVAGSDIMAAARDASQRAMARSEARDAATRAYLLREEERVAELKRRRGERWLPSVAPYMQS